MRSQHGKDQEPMAASEKHRRLVQRRKQDKRVKKLKARIVEARDRQERERLVAKLLKMAPKAQVPS
ncbi:MAG: hypothetical protein H6648_09995 [Caldilineae bacterium]|nr:hypothetical protein [Caldilineae bacterium]